MPRGFPVLCCSLNDKNKQNDSYKTHVVKPPFFWTHLVNKHQKHPSFKTMLRSPFVPDSSSSQQREVTTKTKQSIYAGSLCCPAMREVTDWKKVPRLNSPTDVENRGWTEGKNDISLLVRKGETKSVNIWSCVFSDKKKMNKPSVQPSILHVRWTI